MVDTGLGSGRLHFAGRDTELAALRRALRRPDCKAVVITGAHGVGKSRLAEEFSTGAGGRGGHRVVRVQATHSARALPLSALAPLLSSDVYAEEPAEFIRRVRRRMAAHRSSATTRTVLVVDDIQLLDPTSLALIALLLADSSLFLAVTLPDGADWPDVLRSLWREDALRHIALPTLGEEESARLLIATMGGPVAAPALRALWEASGGNALCLRELLRSALADGRLSPVHGVWCLTRPLAAVLPDALLDVRLRELTGPQRTLMELLAVCGPIGLRDGLTYVDADALAGLERQQLVESHLDGRREQLTLAHPMHARLLRAGITRLRARTLLLDQVGRVRGHGARRAGDPLALAGWELEATGTADPALLVRAAAQALHADDVDTMCRLARAALVHGPNTRAGLMLGEALGQRGEFGEGIAVLEDAFAAAREPDLHTAALTLAVHHFFGPGNMTRALAVIDEAGRRGGPCAEMAAWEATLLTSAGRTARARTVLDPWLPPSDGAEPSDSGVLLLQARLRVELSSGRPEDAVRSGRAAHAAHRVLADRSAVFYPARSLYLVAAALLEAGRFDEAERAASEGLEGLLRSPVPALVVWFGWVRGRIALDRGRCAEAVAHFREARAQAHLCGHRFAEQRALAGLVLAEAYAGRSAPETAVLASGSTDPHSPLAQADTLRAQAWSLRCRGRRHEAEAVLRAGAEAARAGEEFAAALTLEHDLLRWGDRDAAPRVRELAEDAQGPYAAARAAHARAVADRDPDALVAVADAWTAMGALLLAAESLAEAAGLWHASGGAAREGAGRRATARAHSLRRQCGDAATPALADLSTAVQLSPREREIARLAAHGHTSREIADQCSLSVRTVDNALGRVYRKLGIHDRGGLGRAWAL
ncbi:AAA family ATPase [Streptomyces sp. NPDC002328]|uniref:helix-turn-helix transcriptional regulator n=1 Tax=Streptomyces sp. NPDC002328 TaxID=3364642 RepID=UPI0036A43EDD